MLLRSNLEFPANFLPEIWEISTEIRGNHVSVTVSVRFCNNQEGLKTSPQQQTGCSGATPARLDDSLWQCRAVYAWLCTHAQLQKLAWLSVASAPGNRGRPPLNSKERAHDDKLRLFNLENTPPQCRLLTLQASKPCHASKCTTVSTATQ